MAKFITIIVAVLVIGGGVYFYTNNSDETTKEAVSNSDSVNVDNKPQNSGSEITVDEPALVAEQVERDSANQEVMSDSDEETVVPQETPLPGSYQQYSPEKLALADSGDVILFFHATWCPSCKALESDINSNLQNIPENMHILKLDYDSEKDLKKRYDVTRQHTLIQVDADGNEIKRLPYWLLTLDSIVSDVSS